MSTIIADNLTGKTSAGSVTVTSEGGAATQSLQQGLTKVWVKFGAYSTNTIFDSVNVTSFTDNGTGNFTVNFNNNMGNAFYSATAGKWNSASNTGFTINCQDNDSSLQDVITFENDVATDPHACSLAIHGDLA